MSTKFLEIETKYSADEIKLTEFSKLCVSLKPERRVAAGSYDHYYEKELNHFIRYREGACPQLTMKQKSKGTNNWIRTELNLPLDPSVDSLDLTEISEKFCEMLGFHHNFTIWKNYVIYFWNGYNVVYYVVYDEQMKEKGRFIEIEMDEHKAWASEEEAWKLLAEVEKALEPIGISAAKRLRLSLYERFRESTGAEAERV